MAFLRTTAVAFAIILIGTPVFTGAGSIQWTNEVAHYNLTVELVTFNIRSTGETPPPTSTTMAPPDSTAHVDTSSAPNVPAEASTPDDIAIEPTTSASEEDASTATAATEEMSASAATPTATPNSTDQEYVSSATHLTTPPNSTDQWSSTSESAAENATEMAATVLGLNSAKLENFPERSCCGSVTSHHGVVIVMIGVTVIILSW